MKILAVDDDEMILELLELAIQVFGEHQVETASSGPEALQKMADATAPYDCFLLDIQMPRMTGVDLCGNIRSRPDYHDTPIVMLTAMSDKRYIDAAFQAGATDFIVKPFDILELKNRLQLAEKRNLDTQNPGATQHTLDALADQLVEANPYKFADPIPMLEVDHALRPEVFSTYLQELHRLQYLRTKVFAVQVMAGEAIYRNSSGLEFRDHMTDISEAIADRLSEAHGLQSYLGAGIFCCVIDSEFEEILGELPYDLDIAIYNLGMVYRNGAPVDVQFEIGEAITPSIFSKLEAPEIIHKALSKLSEKHQSLQINSIIGNRA